MVAATETDLSQRKMMAMSEWAAVLVRDSHDVLERMDTRLTLAEAKIALVREVIAHRHENHE
ncbi:hypothetical protein [Fimbriiglobus ruber]|uniref:Uncharacterized protein n=1 Tax=Fimbriiglobus ruber TaxID=1908690 RepID=A0A225DR43_9BACT|nr:hypothetical protein [Fimbriiglobus ruber]OWK42104.1 hypothetical protein FRUB_04182 [Fimbriiglobus ruber]